MPHNQAITIPVRLQSLNSCNSAGQTDILELEIRFRILGGFVDTVSRVVNTVTEADLFNELILRKRQPVSFLPATKPRAGQLMSDERIRGSA